MARVRVATAAYRDLEQMLSYLSGYSPPAARRVGFALVGRIDRLAQFPRFGRLLEQRAGVEYRQTVLSGYVIRYRYDEAHEVIVLSIRHGRRLQPSVGEQEGSTEEEDREGGT